MGVFVHVFFLVGRHPLKTNMKESVSKKNNEKK